MKPSIKTAMIICLGVVILIITALQIQQRTPIKAQLTTLNSAYFGDIVAASPGGDLQALSVVFADLQRFNAQDLAQRMAAAGSVVAVLDSRTALLALSGNGQHCLDSKLISEPVQLLDKWVKVDNGRHIIAGIGDGALLAFLASQDGSITGTDFLSVDFSSTLPQGIGVCPPHATDPHTHALQAQTDAASPNHWRAVWTDQPEPQTGIFVRSIANAETDIAAYDTPLDQVLLHEITTLLGQRDL